MTKLEKRAREYCRNKKWPRVSVNSVAAKPESPSVVEDYQAGWRACREEASEEFRRHEYSEKHVRFSEREVESVARFIETFGDEPEEGEK